MKQFSETFLITVSLLFVFWLIITAGINCEVKINGGIYGFKIGGMNERERFESDMLAYWNNCDNPLYVMISDSMLLTGDMGDFIDINFPIYTERRVGISQNKSLYLLILSDKSPLTRDMLNSAWADTKREGYTVVSHGMLTKNLDH